MTLQQPQGFHFPTTGEMMLGAVTGIIAAVILVLWFGDQIDDYIRENRGFLKLRRRRR